MAAARRHGAQRSGIKEETAGRGTAAELSARSACGPHEVWCIRHWIPGQARDDNPGALSLIILQTQRHLIQGVACLASDLGSEFDGSFQGQFGQQQLQDAVVRLA